MSDAHTRDAWVMAPTLSHSVLAPVLQEPEVKKGGVTAYKHPVSQCEDSRQPCLPLPRRLASAPYHFLLSPSRWLL